MIDLHAHTTRSDGSYSPTQLVELAAQRGLSALALTDHDTVSGVREASVAASRLGLHLVAGVELEVDYRGGEFHLLGLGLHEAPERVEETLTEMRGRRRRRNEGIVRKMREDGVEVDFEDVAAFSKGPVLGRPHFARFLVDRGIARSVQDAFDRFLARNQKYYLPIEHLTVAECASVIHGAGGRTVLAHPMTLGLSIREIEDRLPEWQDGGLEGIEAYHPNTPLKECRELEALAKRCGLFVTAGSDFHGATRPDRSLGFTSEGIEIDDRFLAELEDSR